MKYDDKRMVSDVFSIIKDDKWMKEINGINEINGVNKINGTY